MLWKIPSHVKSPLAYFIKSLLKIFIYSVFSSDEKIYAKNFFLEFSIREIMCLVSELIIYLFLIRQAMKT